MADDEVFNLEEAAAFLKVSPVLAKQLIKMGYLRVARAASPRGRILTLRSECIAAVKKLMDKPVQPLPRTGVMMGSSVAYHSPGHEAAVKELAAIFAERLPKKKRGVKPGGDEA